MIEIPVFTTQAADFTQIIDLDNVTVTIRLVFNIRVESWFMRLETENYTLDGIKLVENYPLIQQYKALFPELPGDFLIQQINDEVENPEFDYDSFGVFWSLFYFTEDEVTDWEVENGIG